MKKFLLAATTILLVVSQTSFAAFNFTDISEETDYYASMDWMYRNSVINGYLDGSFKPDKCVNRVEFLKMLFMTLEINVNKSTAELFPDTPASEWYAPYVRTAREMKTINGYPDGTFKPGQCVNRVEAIKMAVLAFNNDKLPEAPILNGDAADYGNAKDVDQNEWYFKYFNYAMIANLVGTKHQKNLDSKGRNFNFLPNDAMSRKEVAEMLYRMKTVKDNYLEVFDTLHEPDPVHTLAEMDFEFDQIKLTDVGSEMGPKLSFHLYLSRPDLKLSQKTEEQKLNDPMALTVDLPISLQPKLIYISNLDDTNYDTGSMCDRPRFPHECTVIIPNEELGKSSYTYLLKVTFEDDSYASKEITIPYPKSIDKPEIIEPKSIPAQQSKFDLQFKDVGAKNYDINLSLCKEYNDDGINPCLDGVDYYLERTSKGELKEQYANELYPATITITNGIVHIISDVEIKFEESISYTVTAKSQTVENKVDTYIENSDTKTYVP